MKKYVALFGIAVVLALASLSTSFGQNVLGLPSSVFNSALNALQVNLAGLIAGEVQGAQNWMRSRIAGELSVYSASTTVKTTGAAGTNPFFAVCGSATRTMRVQSINIDYTVATLAVQADPRIQKTSTATAGGTATSLTQTPLDSTMAAATASQVKVYTANDATPGALVGTIFSQMAWAQVTATVTAGSSVTKPFTTNFGRDTDVAVLRGIAQCLEASFGTTTTNAPTWTVNVIWTEE